MSLKIIKAGIADSVQDSGRYGNMHLGINVNGAMDRVSAALANALLGKTAREPVIEIHFPASLILFEKPTIICISGADFQPVIADCVIDINRPYAIPAGSTLSFRKKIKGWRCYLSIYQHLNIDLWLGSYSTNLKAKAGGMKGRYLATGDTIVYEKDCVVESLLKNEMPVGMKWIMPTLSASIGGLLFIPGPEWDRLTDRSKQHFLQDFFTISRESDRMGYRLQGKPLQMASPQPILSSGVTNGTIQLLPSGQLIVLMADHPTTGGYPRIANIISADLPLLAQINQGDRISFQLTSVKEAEEKLKAQRQLIRKIRNAASLNFQKILA